MIMCSNWLEYRVCHWDLYGCITAYEEWHLQRKKSQCDSYTWYLSIFDLWHWVLLKISATLAQLWYFHGVALFISAHSLGGPGPVLVLTGVWIYFNRPLMGSVCQQLPTCYSLPHTGWYTSANGPTVCLCANTWYTPGAWDGHFAPNIAHLLSTLNVYQTFLLEQSKCHQYSLSIIGQ